jgi:hypothetical protein
LDPHPPPMSPAHSDSLDVTSLQDGDSQTPGLGSLPQPSRLLSSPTFPISSASGRPTAQSAVVSSAERIPAVPSDHELQSELHPIGQQNTTRGNSDTGRHLSASLVDSLLRCRRLADCMNDLFQQWSDGQDKVSPFALSS